MIATVPLSICRRLRSCPIRPSPDVFCFSRSHSGNMSSLATLRFFTRSVTGGPTSLVDRHCRPSKTLTSAKLPSLSRGALSSANFSTTTEDRVDGAQIPELIHGDLPGAADHAGDPLEYYESPFTTSAFRTTNRKFGQLLPHVQKTRIDRLKTYQGRQINIRHSPWRLNLVCSLAARCDDLPEALKQLQFCVKAKAPLVAAVISRTSNLADIRDGLHPAQLEVAECFATKGTPLKRVDIKGRGRTGRKERRHSHMRVVLREIDFDLKIAQSKTPGERRKWFNKAVEAKEMADISNRERAELQALDKAAAAMASEADKK